jgi:class 3 adenylate cyclase
VPALGPDLTAADSLPVIEKTIREGMGHMPKLGNQLSADEIAAVAKYADRRFKGSSKVREPPVMTTPGGSPARRTVGDLEAHASPDGTVTLMFSDLEGFTQMTERLGDAAMHRLMQVHHHIVREQTEAHGGHELELRGDGFLLAFADGLGAVRRAVALQSAFARHSRESPREALRVRIGLHAGEVIQDRDTFFGKTVIQAFRIADLAVGGEILVSSELKALVEDVGEIRFDEPREVGLKGMSGRHRILPVRWQ